VGGGSKFSQDDVASFKNAPLLIELIILKRPGYRHSARITVRVAIASCAEHTATGSIMEPEYFPCYSCNVTTRLNTRETCAPRNLMVARRDLKAAASGAGPWLGIPQSLVRGLGPREAVSILPPPSAAAQAFQSRPRNRTKLVRGLPRTCRYKLKSSLPCRSAAH
jgi:hypothetical protein